MHIERTKILNVDRYLKLLPPKSTFKIISAATAAALARAGFEEGVASGAIILPAVRGRTSRFNAEGKWNVRRDLPKEERFLFSRVFRRMEWHGQDRVEVEDVVDYKRMCYPRELVPPPGVELTYVEHDADRLIVSPELQYVPGNDAHNRHVINLMLELFGSCEIVLENLARLTPPATRRAHWVMLPPGEDPWNRIRAHVKGVYGTKSPQIAEAVLQRQQTILAHEPKDIIQGTAGFSDYIAYLFPDRDLVVLESVFYGNAMYLFGQNWERLSQLTKAQIIQGELAKERIVHSKGWIGKLADAMRLRAA